MWSIYNGNTPVKFLFFNRFQQFFAFVNKWRTIVEQNLKCLFQFSWHTTILFCNYIQNGKFLLAIILWKNTTSLDLVCFQIAVTKFTRILIKKARLLKFQKLTKLTVTKEHSVSASDIVFFCLRLTARITNSE